MNSGAILGNVFVERAASLPRANRTLKSDSVLWSDSTAGCIF